MQVEEGLREVYNPDTVAGHICMSTIVKSLQHTFRYSSVISTRSQVVVLV